MAAPAPVTPWLCFPAQAVLGEGGRVQGGELQIRGGLWGRDGGVRKGLQLLRMERAVQFPVPLTRSSLNLRKTGGAHRTKAGQGFQQSSHSIIQPVRTPKGKKSPHSIGSPYLVS